MMVVKIAVPSGGGGDRERLDDSDTGLWLVSTEVSAYIVDLDKRRILRLPGAAAAPHFAADGALVVVTDLDGDREWCQLSELTYCHLGEPLLAVDFSARGVRHRRITTLVQRIDRCER